MTPFQIIRTSGPPLDAAAEPCGLPIEPTSKSKRKKRVRGLSVLIVLPKPGLGQQAILDSVLGVYDHIAYLRAEDLPPVKSSSTDAPDEDIPSILDSFISRISFGKRIESVDLVASNGTSAQLDILLDRLLPILDSDTGVTVGGFRLRSDQFVRLTSQISWLSFIACTFGAGWWKPPTENRICSWLSIANCTGSFPKSPAYGQSAWAGLTSIFVSHQSRSGSDVYRVSLSAVPWIPRESEEFARRTLFSLWASPLEHVLVRDFQSLDFICSFPNLKKLKTLDIIAQIDEDVFTWILGNANLRSLTLEWAPETRLPWRKLRSLKRLRDLSVDGTPLDDEQLAEISESAALRSVRAYYTKITANSWPTILSWPGLKVFWGSQELASSEPLTDLPGSTSLVEFVALNTTYDWFRALLSRYPGVKVFQM